jgi:hypothetical protein
MYALGGVQEENSLLIIPRTVDVPSKWRTVFSTPEKRNSGLRLRKNEARIPDEVLLETNEESADREEVTVGT